MKKILFVCSGNTCRSPLAEGIAKKVLSGDRDVVSDISSAGTSAMDGMPASFHAIEIAKTHSVDLSSHRARLLTRKLVLSADLIVAMCQSHRETVGVLEPSALSHTYLLTDFCDDEDGDVLDPIGMGMETYEETYLLMEKCIGAFKQRLDTFDGWKK